MRKIFIVPVLVFAAFNANAQVRQSDIVSAGGGYAEKGTISLSSTIGEPARGTLTSGTLTMVLGFQQAFDINGTGISDNKAKDGLDVNVSIYPNPVSDFVKVKLSNAVEGKLNVLIMNNMGAVLKSVDFDNETEVTIDAADMPKGVYLVRVIAGSTLVKTQKIIKL